jgi:hypothetical protein
MNRMLDLSDSGCLQKCRLPDRQVDGVSTRRNRYRNWGVVFMKLLIVVRVPNEKRSRITPDPCFYSFNSFCIAIDRIYNNQLLGRVADFDQQLTQRPPSKLCTRGEAMRSRDELPRVPRGRNF